MSTNLPPSIAKGMLDQKRGAGKTSETEQALERSTTKGRKSSGAEPEAGEDKLARAAEQNAQRKDDDG